MDFRDLKEYTKLNLRRSGLVLSEADRKKVKPLSDAFRTIVEADHGLDAFHNEVKQNRMERFCYASMSLSYWALVVGMSILGMLLDEYLKEGTLVVGLDFAWALYILPAIFLVGRFFLFSYINIAHGVLLVACAALSIFQIRIFGSEMNWIWVFLVVGTILTLAGRLWEGSHRMKENNDWWNGNVKMLNDAEKAIAQAVPVYTSLGAEAEAELQKRFPDIRRPGRTPWFQYQRKVGSLLDVPSALTDFRTAKPDRKEDLREVGEHGTRHITVYGEEMGYEPIEPAAAQNMIRRGKMNPFFGMAVPAYVDGLKYTIFVHRWKERIHDVGEFEYTENSRVYTGDKRRAQQAYDELESKHLGTTAEIFAAKTKSGNAWAETQDYMLKKEQDLNRRSDYAIRSRTISGDINRWDEKSYEESALICVKTPDGALVGLYCADNKDAILLARSVAADHWGIDLTGWATPSGEIQRRFLNCYYNGTFYPEIGKK